MASILQFSRRPPMIRHKPDPVASSDSREEQLSLQILIWTFAGAALAMCLTVVILASNSWADVLYISAFLMVFTLLKIGLAQAVFYVMIRYDKDHPPAVPAKATRPLTYRRMALSGRDRGKVIGAPRLAAIAKPPRPRAPENPPL